jgi:TolC family type I secretion outer membrane protein
MLKITVLVVGACAATLLFGDQRAAAETLTETLSMTYQSNPRLSAQRARVRTEDERVPQALSGWRPTVRATGEMGYRRVEQEEDQAAVNASDDVFPRSVRGEIAQPLYRGGRTLAATRSAENRVRAERARLLAAEQIVLLDAVRAYADVFRDQSVVDLNIRNEQRLAKQLEATKDRFRVGEVTRTDVFQAEARLARAAAERIRAEGTLENSRATFKNVAGQMPGKLIRAPLPSPLPKSREATATAAFGGNPNITAAEFDERSTLDEVDRARGQLLPTLDLVGAAEREYEQVRQGSRFDAVEALVRLNVPLYQSGIEYSQLRASKQAVSERRRLLDQARRNTEEAATQAWNNLETTRAAIKSFQKQVQANEVALEGVTRESEVGARTVLDILDAEQELLDSQVDLVSAERDEIVAAFEVIAAIGGLTARGLQLPVEYYDPEVHYNEVRDSWFGGESTGDTSNDFQRR